MNSLETAETDQMSLLMLNKNAQTLQKAIQ